MQCPKCHCERIDPLDVRVILLWGYCLSCDHLKLEDFEHESHCELANEEKNLDLFEEEQ